MLIFVPVRMVSERDIEALRQETTSATRHDFLTPFPVGDTVSKVRAALAGALGVAAETLEIGAQPETLRVVGRNGMTTTLVEAKVFPVGKDGSASTVQLAAMSRDRVSPTLMVMALAFVGMAVAFFGGIAAAASPLLTGIAVWVLPFVLGLPYVSIRKRAVENSSKSLFAAFRAMEGTVVPGKSV